MKTTSPFVPFVIVALVAGCSGDETGGPSDDGGSSNAGGAHGGGASGAPATAGRASAGGTASTGGRSATGGTHTTSGGASSSSAGRDGRGGASGSAGSTGSGGSSAAAGGAGPGAGGSGSGNLDHWVIVNHPCYQWDQVPAANVPWAHVSDLIVGYLWPKGSGSDFTLDTPPGVCGDWNSFKSKVAAYVDAGHKAGRKVTMQLGGAGSNPGNIWNTATSSVNVGTFAQNIYTLLSGIGIDGVDIDWEDNVNAAQMVALAKELRSRWANGVITIPTGPTGADAKDLAGAKDAVDAFEPMTYMVVEQWGGWRIPVPLTPLFAYQSNPYSVDIVRKAWLAAGVPASKLIMGIGGYGTLWSDSNGDGHAPVAPYVSDANGPADSENGPTASDNAVTQSWLNKTLAAHSDLVEGWDDVGKCSYWHAPSSGSLVTVAGPSGGNVKVGSIFFETPRSMGEKLGYVESNGMKGFMFWTLAELVDGTSSPVLEAL